MIRELKVGKIKWIDGVNFKNTEIEKHLSKYNIHELDVEACMESNQRARIDNYDDYSFLILHFPKYDRTKMIYELNEFDIFLGKDFLVTNRNSTGNHINSIFNNYKQLKVSVAKEEIKVTSGYILYEITQAMLEKMYRVISNIDADIRKIEDQVFNGRNNATLVRRIMLQKRNIIMLKHMFQPQVSVLNQLESTVNKLYAGSMEVYFEDLEDKLGQIVNEINLLQEYIESVEDAGKSMVDIKTNFVIKVLTVFSAFMLPLTLITSFYGMNVSLPFTENLDFVFLLLVLSGLFMGLVYFYLRRNGKF